MHHPFHDYTATKDIRKAAATGDVDAAFRHGQAVAIARCLTSELMGGGERTRNLPIIGIHEWCRKP
jgi:hypothetical protein